jgi:uncharacterized protein (TIGR00369 family)
MNNRGSLCYHRPMELLPAFGSCFFCGHENPAGFSIRYLVDPATGRVEGQVTPEESYCGFPGILHGGIQAALLDDVMWWVASYQGGTSAVTLELNTTFAKEAPLGKTLHLIGEPGQRQGRKQHATGRLEDNKGNTLCSAKALYLLFTKADFDAKAKPLMDFDGCSDNILKTYGA